MTTAKEIVTDALQKLLVLQDEAPIEASDAQLSLRTLNDIMSAWAVDGVNLGYTEVLALGDTITVPSGAIGAMKVLLACELFPTYKSSELTQTLAIQQRAAQKTMYKLGVAVIPSVFSANTPIGSGNRTTFGDSAFYPDQSDSILSEVNGSISLEDSTDD